MSEVLGSGVIELRLDQSRLNRDLRDLETLQLKPIALGLKLNLPQLQQQLKGVRLDPVNVALRADTSSLQTQLQAFSTTITVKAKLDTTEVDRQLKAYAGERTLKLTARVDDRELTALNKHLDLKAKHFAQVNDEWRRSPLTPRTDLRQLDALDGRLRSLQKRYDIDVNLRVNAGALRSQIGSVEVPVILRYANAQPLGALTQKVEIDSKGIEDSLGNSVERAFKRVKGGGLLSGLGGLVTAPLKLAGSGISTILGGLTLGATQEVSRNLGKGLSTALEGALSKSVGSSELLGEKVGGAIGSAVVQEFQTQTQNLAQVLDRQLDKIQDTKLRRRLREELKSAVELPGLVGQAAQATIGEENINRERLFQQGQRRQSQQAKTPVIQEQAVQEYRDSITVTKQLANSDVAAKLAQELAVSQRSAATAQKALGKIDTLIQTKFGQSGEQFRIDVAPLFEERKREQAELALVNAEIKRITASIAADQKGIAKLQTKLQSAQKDGNPAIVGQITEQIATAQLRLEVAQESLTELGDRKQTASGKVGKVDQKISQQFGQPSEEVIRYAGAFQKAQQRTIAAQNQTQEVKEQQQVSQIAKQNERAKRQQLDAVSPQQQPKAYQDLAQNVLQESFDASKLPKLVVDDQYLKEQGAGSLYSAAQNAIITTQEIYDAVKSAALTQQQADILGEEIAHAEDFDFGSFEGIQARKLNRPIGRRVTATEEEASRFAPELGRYAPEVREFELNAKVKGTRGATAYVAKQDQFQAVSEVSELAVQQDKVYASDSRKNLFKSLGVLKQVAQERFVTVDKDIAEAINRYQEAFTTIGRISDQATQTAGTATREEITALQQEMQAALDSINGLFDSIGGEIQRLKQINPLEANQNEIDRLLAVTNQNSTVPGIDAVKAVLVERDTKNQEIIEAIRQELEESDVQPDQIEAEAKRLAESKSQIINQIQKDLTATGQYLENLLASVEQAPDTSAGQIAPKEASRGLATTIDPAELAARQQSLTELLQQRNVRKKDIVPLAEQFGIENADKLKKKDLIQQLVATANVEQLEPKVFDLTRAKGQQQLERREQRAAVAETVGAVAKGAVNLAGATASKAQDIAQSAPVQGALQAAGIAGKALLAVGKASYTVASAAESLTLDFIPAGRALKGIAQQTVVPAALFAGATALLPGGAAVASGLSHVVGGVASPLLHAAGAGATDAASSAIAGHVPNAFGLANGITTALTGAIDGAVNAASAGIAQAGAAILGGKAIQTVAGRTIGGAAQAVTGQAALPPSQAKALPSAQTDVEAIPVTVEPVPQQPQTKQIPAARPAPPAPREGREGLFQDLNEQYSAEGLREIAKRVGITSKRARSLKKEDLARELASTNFGVPLDKVLAEVGDSAKLKAFQTGTQGTTPKLPAEALTSIKTAGERLKQLYKQFQTAQGQQRVVLAQTIATESAQQIAAIDQAFKEFQIEGKTAQQLAGLRTQANQRTNVTVPEAIAAQRPQIQETQRQAGASRNFQTVEARVIDRSSGDDLNAANLLDSLREGSQAVNRELGAAIERFNQAQHNLAETLSREVARFAEIEPEQTLPATLQKAAATPKGKDLLVNTAGFAASVAGNHFGGAVGGAAGDLIGALTARHALSGGQHGQGDELFGDIAGFAIGNGAAALGNLIPGVAGIPFKGAAAAIATVPQLTKLRQRIQGRLGEDDEAKAGGDDLAAANLTSGATSIKRTLTSKSRQLLSQLEKQLGDTIDALALALSSDKDYAGNAGKQEIRALNQLNQTVERLLEERGEIINETFDAEMTRANQELLQIGARIAAKTEARPDFGLLADRAIGDGTQAKSQQVIGENQQELRENKRRAFDLERQTGVVADPSLTRIENPITGGDGLKGAFSTLRNVFKGIQEDLRAAVTRQAEALTVESKSLLNDIRSSQAVAKGEGDKTQATRLRKAGDRTERAIAGSEAILSKPNSSLSDKDLAKLKEYQKELLSVYRLLDRPPPPAPTTGGAGGFGQLLEVFGKLKPLIGPVLAGLIGFQGVQFAATQLKSFADECLQASIKLDNLKTALDFASGGSSQGTQSLEFVRKTVSDLGTPLQSSIEGFSQLSAATRGTAAAGKTTKDVFLGIEEASTVLGLSADQTGGSLLALTQIASKGTVQAEELRGQLGERIPGAFSVAARAMGVTDAQLNKMLETGSVLADDFLPRFGKQLQTEFGDAAKTAGDNAQSAIFRFQNAYLTLQQTVGKELQPGAVVGLKTLEFVFKGLAAIAPEIILALSSIALTITVQSLPALYKLIANLILTKAATGTAIGGLQSFFQTLNTSKTAIATVGLFALVEYFKLLSETINTEVVKSFDDMADAAERAAKNSKEVKLPGQPDKPDNSKQEAKEDAAKPAPLAGPLDTLVRGNIDFSDPLRPKLVAGKTTFRNFGDVERDRVGADIGESVGQTSNFLSKANLRLTTLKTKTGVGADLQQVDQQLFDAQSQRKVLQEEAERDYTRKGKTIPAELQQKIQDANTNIQGLVEKRGDAAKPFTDDLNAANQLIDSYKGKLKELDDPAKEGHFGNKAQTEERRKQLQEALKDVTALKNQSQEQLGSFRVDPILGLADGFKKLASAIDDAERATKLFVSQQKSAVLQNQLKTFGTDEDAGRTAALSNAITERQGTQQSLDATDKALKTGEALIDRPEAAQALAGFGVSKASSISDVKKELEATPEDESGKAKRKILQDLLNFKELQQKKADLQVNLDEADLKVTDQVQTNALAVIDRDASKRDSQLKRDDDARAIPIRKASADLVRDRASNKFFSDADAGVAEADLGIKSAQNQVTSADQKEANTQQTLADLNAKKDSLSAEEFNKRQRELTTQLADLRVEKANAAAAVEDALAKKVEATNRKVVEGLELANQKASAAIQLSETNQTTSVKKKLLSAGLTDRNEKESAVAQTAVDEAATQKRNALIQKEIADYKKLATDKRITGKELTEKLLGFNQELAANNDKLVDLQIQRQKQLRDLFNDDVDRKVAASNRADQAIIRGLQRQKAAIEQINQSLEISRKLTESRSSLQQAIAQYNQTIAQGAVDQASKKVEIANKAETEQDPTKREGYEKIARSLGIADPSDKGALLDQKLAAEKNLADIKQRALETEYALKQQLLELDLKRDKLQAQQAVREAQIAELNAKKDVTKAAGELKKAVKEGDPDKIAEAKSNLDDSLQAYDISKQNTAGAQEGLAATGELEANARAKLGVERDTAFAQNAQEQQNQAISQATDRVEAGLDPDRALGTNTGGGVQTNYGVQSGNYAASSAFRVGGFRNDDRGLRDTSTAFSPRQVTPAPDASSGVVEASSSTGDRLGSFFDSLSSALTQRLDVLIDLTRQDMGNPKSVAFHATDPAETYAQYQNRQTGNALRSQPAY